MSTTRGSLTSILALLFVTIVEFAIAQTPLRLVPVTPCRLVDTRMQGQGGPIQGGTFRPFDLRQLAQSGACAKTGLNLSSAAAYSLNVTVVTINNGPVGYLTIWPTGVTQPVVSLMNSPDGRIKANAAIVPAGTDGEVNVYVTNTTNVLLDIDGYFDSASDNSALAFFPLSPCRVVDTRNPNGPLGGPPLTGGVARSFPIQQSPPPCSIPSTAKAYSFNFTVVPINHHSVGYLTVWPTGQSQPVVSTLNDTTGTIVANAAIVPSGNDQFGSIEAYATDNTNLLVDINGYFAPANSTANPLSLYTLVPCRVFDSRKTIGLFNGTIPVGVVGSSCGVPNVALGFVFNATVVPPGPMGFLTLWPEGQQQPVVSTLNATDGAITSNMAIVPTTNGSIDAYAQNNTQLFLDISSYFAPIAKVNVLTASLPDGTINQPYNVSLVAAGGVAPYTWSLTSGSLPPGMNPLSSAGVISGTPTSTGLYSFTVKATDALSNSASANLSITVNGSAGTLRITTTTLPIGTINTPYNALLAANGGITPYTWSIVSGALPVGLSLNSSTGQISGTPAAGGLSVFTVEVTDAHSNSATQPLDIAINTGDANGTLNGNYAFSFNGYDAGSPSVGAGSFIADGNGNITGGVYDHNGGTVGLQIDQPITGGSYSISADGFGTITLNTANGPITFGVATGAPEDMRIIHFNESGLDGSWGSGVFRQQDPSAFNLAALAGNWALGIQGFDHSGHPRAVAGRYQEDSQGDTAGVEDINDFGTDLNDQPFTGSPVGSIDPTYGRVTTQIVLNGKTYTNAVYTVSANEKLFVAIDSGGVLQTGSNLRQNATLNNGTLNGLSVLRGASQSGHGGSNVFVGLVTTDGNGNITVKLDQNKDGNVGQSTVTGTYSVASNGRTVVNLSDGSTQYAYLVGPNEAFVVNTGTGASLAFFEPQSGNPFSNVSFSGEFLGGTLPAGISSVDTFIESFLSDSNGNIFDTYDESGSNGTNLNQMATFTYSVDSTGRMVLMSGANTVGIGYIVSPTKMFLIDGANGDQNSWAEVFERSSASR